MSGIFAFYYIRYKTAPDITSKSIVFDTAAGIDSLDSYRGQDLVLVFFASWCGPCMREMPDLISVYPELQAKGVEVIGLTDDPPGKLNLVKEKFQPPFDLFKIDGDFKKIGIYTIPTIIVINKKGEVVFEHVDVINWKDPSIINEIVSSL
jgi:peroxiredoxin